MPSVTFEYQTEGELAALRQAAAFIAEMHQLAHAAPAGQVLHLCEARALDHGRRLLRDTLQDAAQTRIDAAEQKGATAAPARAPAATA